MLGPLYAGLAELARGELGDRFPAGLLGSRQSSPLRA